MEKLANELTTGFRPQEASLRRVHTEGVISATVWGAHRVQRSPPPLNEGLVQGLSAPWAAHRSGASRRTLVRKGPQRATGPQGSLAARGQPLWGP